MKHFEYEISGIDGSAAKFVGYCLDNSEEVVPDRVRPSVLVIPGGGYEMTSDRFSSCAVGSCRCDDDDS